MSATHTQGLSSSNRFVAAVGRLGADVADRLDEDQDDIELLTNLFAETILSAATPVELFLFGQVVQDFHLGQFRRQYSQPSLLRSWGSTRTVSSSI